MRDLTSFQHLKDEVAGWRRYLHQHPELDYRLPNTARFVTETLQSFGINHIETGIAETGIVAIVHGSAGEGPTIGLRADMDALPIFEASGKQWTSTTPGQMHACGHDGHTAMLLGAAKHLAATRNFKGSVALIFQPAEEGMLGGQRMVQEGIMDRFDISQVFGMHNLPGMPVGTFGICDGPIMAALDEYDLVIKGRGGHAAMPHQTVDPVVIAAHVILGLQTLVSRMTDALESLVISVTKMDGGEAYNIVPEQITLSGTVRTLSPKLRDFAEERIRACAQGIARTFGGDAELSYRRHDPVTMNHTAGTERALRAARSLVGDASVDTKFKPLMGSEDFAYMLEARPGAFIFAGNGNSASLHNPSYDFDDEALPYGIGYWVNLVETTLAA
ncbi:M20 aminoacylase family protein [Mesorhizobium kowhaii]|uniref:M20 aminoacylase family protein n=1 Tax=Mesorhizobium kowhaii TaxID=1300272 RepID=UPI0035EA1D13